MCQTCLDLINHLGSLLNLIATGEAIPLRGLGGFPGLPGAPQDEAGLTRKFETSHVGLPLELFTG